MGGSNFAIVIMPRLVSTPEYYTEGVEYSFYQRIYDRQLHTGYCDIHGSPGMF